MIQSLNLPVPLHVKDQDLTLRRATPDDLDALRLLLADDPISATRGDNAADADADAYGIALRAIVADPSNDLLVVSGAEHEPLAMMQLTRIPGLARGGSTRLLVEAVRVSSGNRSSGIGSAMLRWVMESAALSVGARLVQLTSDEARQDAHRFYERLGFVGSHRGFKYAVE
nr:GNAT family N-acetyltransferase [uncultured Arthrobacter sp.]